MSMMRYGVHAPLEEVANALLKQSLKGVTRYRDKADVLTPWKEEMRKRREILVAGGVADPSVRQGMYHRGINPGRPDLNSRDGIARFLPRQTNPSAEISSLAAHVAEYAVFDERGSEK